MMKKLHPRTSVSQHIVPGLGQVQLQSKIRKHYEAPHTWEIKTEVASAGQQLGSAKSLLLLKENIKGSFHGIMDIHSDETLHFAQSIFTSKGSIRPELLNNHVQKGSGVWGEELSKGNLILIEEIRVEKNHRKKGLGRWLLAQILQIPEVASNCNFAFAWPTVLNLDNDCPKSERKNRCALILRFFQQAGFRRVGRTSFVGYAIHDATHLSRTLPIEFDPPLLEEATTSDGREPTPEELTARYPLHMAIASKNEEEAIELIKASVFSDPTSINKRDFAGNTPLHIAAVMGKVQVVRQLLAIGTPQDPHATNHAGSTPLHQLQKELLSSREFFRAMIDGGGIQWPGYGKDNCLSIEELRKAMNLPVPLIQPGMESWMMFQWGCTCGQCLGGWLSPRMKYRFRCYAEMASDMIKNWSEDEHAMQLMTVEDLRVIPMSEYIPSAIRTAGVSPSYLKGYSEVFGAIKRVLAGDSATLLSAEAIEGELGTNDSTSLQYYFAHNGTILHALQAVFATSWEEGPEGNNNFEQMYTRCDEWPALPECENDAAYTLARDRLGLQDIMQLQGFSDEMGLMDDDSDDDLDDSEDEDEDELDDMGSDEEEEEEEEDDEEDDEE